MLTLPFPRLRASAAFGLGVLLLAFPWIGGCGPQNGLVQTVVPQDGVQLRYDLQPGGTFKGHVFRRETVQERGSSFTRSLKFNVNMRVVAVNDDGSHRVKAVVSNLDLQWHFGSNAAVSRSQFAQRALKSIDGVTIPFSVDSDGAIKDVPPPPDGLEDDEKQVLEAVVEGLTSAFYVVPSRKLLEGDKWTQHSTRGKKGRLGKFVESTASYSFEGLFTSHKTGTPARFARLRVDTNQSRETTTKDSTHATRVHSKDELLFAIDGNHLARITTGSTKFTGPVTVTVKFNAQWERTASIQALAAHSPLAAANPSSPTIESQSIADPCDDDYVGSKACDDPCDGNYLGDDSCADHS